MLTFFRRIRKGLLDMGAARKYLLYAVGEILLVMIGILLALQVNNWNEWRKDKILEKEYLTSLKQEFRENIDDANRSISHHSKQLIYSNYVLRFLNDKKILADTLLLLKGIIHSGWTHRDGYIYHVWDELNSTGNIRIINSKELRMSLVYQVREMKKLSIFNDEFNSFNLGYRASVRHIINGDLRLEIGKVMVYGIESVKLQDLKNIDSLRMKNLSKELNDVKDIEGYLVDIIQGKELIKTWYIQHIKRFNEIIEMIDKELNE